MRKIAIITLVGNFNYGNRLQNCKTYAYFFDENKPSKGHPYEFTMAETEKLKNFSEEFFSLENSI